MTQTTGEPVSILLVDDEDDFRLPHAELLRLNYGYQVDEASSAEDALALVRYEGHRYHVALIDEVLEGPVNGIKLMQSLRIEQPHLDVILLTAYGLEPFSEAMQAGAFRFLRKPIGLEQLAQMIEMCVEMQQASTQLEIVQRDHALLGTLLDLSRATSASLEQSQILRATYEHVRHLMDADNLDIVLLDRRQGHLDFALGYDKGKPEEPWSRSFGYSDEAPGLTDWVIRHRAPRLITNYPEEPIPVTPIVRGSEDIRSWLGVPLLRGSRVIGAVTVQSTASNQYDSTDQRILMAVANHVAQALDNAQLYREMDVLDKIIGRIAVLNDLEDLLEAITTEAAQLIDTRNIRIGLHRPDRDEVDILMRYEHGKRTGPRTLTLDQGLVGHTIRTQRPLLLRSRLENQELKAKAGLNTVGRLSASWLSVPLITGVHVIGAIAIQDYEREDAYDSRDQEILTRLASHVAVAVYKAQLMSRVQRGLRQRATLLEFTSHLRPEAELDRDWALWAFLTGVTASYGLGYNRAMLLRWVPAEDRISTQGVLAGWIGIGDMDAESAEQTWAQMDARGIDSLERFLELPRSEYDNTPINQSLQGIRIPVSKDANDGFSRAVFYGQSSVVSGSIQDPSTAPFLGVFEPLEFAVVPLKLGNQLIGALTTDNRFTGEPIDDEAVDLLRSFADVVMTHLDNARLRQELERRVDVLHRYYEMMASLRTIPDRNESLRLVAETLRDLYQLDTCTFGLLDEEGKQLVFDTAHQFGLPSEVVRSIDELPQRQWSHLHESDEPVIIPDLTEASEVRNVLFHPDLQSLVILPVRDIRGRLRGVLTMGRRGPLTVRPEDRDNLKALAGQAGLSLRNAELFAETERRSREQAQLLDIARRITGAVADSDRSVLDEIVQSAKDLMGADVVTVYPFLEPGASPTIPPIASVGLRSSTLPKGLLDLEDRSLGIMGLVQKVGELIVEDLEIGWDRSCTVKFPAPREGGFSDREGIRAFAGFSLLADDEFVGELFVSYRQPHSFDEEELLLLENFAAQAAISLQKELLMRRVERLLESQIDAVDGLQQVEELVGIPDCPLDDVWRAILETAVTVTGADRGSFLTMDEKTGNLQRVGTVNVPTERLNEDAEQTVRGKRGITGWVAAQKRSVLVTDVHDDPEWSRWYVDIVPGTQSELVVPILLGAERDLVGIIDLECDRKSAFDQDAQRLVEALAAAAAVAYQNASLYRRADRRQKHLQAQISAARAISASLDLDTILYRILEEAVKLTEIDGKRAHLAVILMWKKDSLVFTRVYPEEKLETLKARLGEHIPIPEGRLHSNGTRRMGICGRVARTKQPGNVPDVEQDEDYLEFYPGTRSELAVPLLAGKRLIGVLNVEHVDVSAFDEEDVEALKALAEQAVIAILNAQTHGELQHRQQELEAKSEELAASNAVALTGILGSTLVHDLQGFVSAIHKGLQEIQYTLPAKPLQEAVAPPIDDMMSATDRIQELASQLRLSPEEQPDLVNIHALLMDRIGDWKKMYRHDEIDWHLAPGTETDSPQARVNRLAFVSALDTLVDNAVVAMRGRPVRRLTISTRLLRERVEIDFEDTGSGVPEEIRSKLFKERIVKRAGESGGGIGGLIVNLIARAAKGGVHLADTSPQGTRVTVWLPVELSNASN